MNSIASRRLAEQRWFERSSGRDGRFEAVAVSNGKPVAVTGTRLAREGLAIVSGTALRDAGDIPVSFTIRRRRIPSRVRVVKHEPLREATGIVHRYFCSFTQLADADREAVARYVDGLPEPAAGATGPLDGALPAQTQATIADELIRLKRLSPTAPGLAPLIRLEAQPPRMLEDGRVVRDVLVHSRVRTADGVRTFMTRFRAFADLSVEVLP
jgi:hypothetical protein